MHFTPWSFGVRSLASACVVCAFTLLSGMTIADDEEKPIEPTEIKLDRPVEFERDVYPILEANCIACHNLATNESEFVAEDAESLMKGGSNGPAVVPGKAGRKLSVSGGCPY